MPSDDWLPDLDDPDLAIEDLIERITVDAHGDEGYWSFRQAFEDHIDFPVAATVVGTHVEITEIDFEGDERRGLTATVTLDGGAVDPSHRGPDLSAGGTLVIGRSDLYHVLMGVGNGEHLIDIAVPAGFRLYTFTFE